MNPNFWLTEQPLLLEYLLPEVEALAIAGVQAAIEDLQALGITISEDDALQLASEWARQHGGQLVTRMTETSQRTVGQIVSNWQATPGTPLSQLVASLTPVLAGNSYRAELVAVTETTRSLAQGADLAYQRAGIPRAVFMPPAHPKCRCWQAPKKVKGEWVQVWQTARDEVVCKTPITVPWQSEKVRGCNALQGVIISEGKYTGVKHWTVK